jgi:hypothetical protein
MIQTDGRLMCRYPACETHVRPLSVPTKISPRPLQGHPVIDVEKLVAQLMLLLAAARCGRRWLSRWHATAETRRMRLCVTTGKRQSTGAVAGGNWRRQ